MQITLIIRVSSIEYGDKNTQASDAQKQRVPAAPLF
jgi:hypothetical protein